MSLNILNRQFEKEQRRAWILDTENNRREELGLDIFKLYSDMEDFNKEKNEEDIDIDVDNDYLLQETANIIGDYVYLNDKIFNLKT